MFSPKDANVTEQRHKYIGGSDIPTILGLNPYKTQFELAKERIGISPRDFGNEYTEFGNAMEPQIREYVNAVNETNFVPATEIEGYLRGNCDGLDRDKGLLLEVKTHGKTFKKAVYDAQAQFYMYVFDVDMTWVAHYERPSDFDIEFDPERLAIYELERDDVFIKKMLESVELFLKRCEWLKEHPDATEEEFYAVGSSEVSVIVQQIEVLERKLADFQELERQYKTMKERLYELMEQGDIKSFETDLIHIVRILPSVSATFDSTRFKKEHPELAEQYSKRSKKKGYVKISVKGDTK